VTNADRGIRRIDDGERHAVVSRTIATDLDLHSHTRFKRRRCPC